MAKFQLTDVSVALSKIPETATNTPFGTSSDFVGALMNASMVPIPQLGKIDDMDMIGDGEEFADNLRADYWQPQSPTIGGKLNTEIAARLFARCLGGAVVDAAVTASVSYDHSVIMQTRAQGRTPKLSTLIMALGGADFLWPSMAVNGFEAGFNGTDPVTFAANLINTGYWKDLSVDYPAIVIPDPETHHYMYAAATVVTFNDGSVVNYAADGRLISGRIGLGNNIVVRGLPGDPFLTAGDPTTGAYARDIHRGRRDGFASIKVSLDENLTEFTKMRNNADITSLTYLFKGDKINATDYYEFEIKVPRCKLRVVSPDTDSEDAALTLDFFLRKDSVSLGLITGRVRNGQATLA